MPHAVSPIRPRALDFHDPAELDDEGRDRAIDAIEPMLLDMFSSLDPSWSTQTRTPDLPLRAALGQWRDTVLAPMVQNKKFAGRYHDGAVVVGELCFKKVDLEQRILAAKITAIAAAIDDIMPHDPQLKQEAECFLRRITSGKLLRSPLLQEFASLIREYADIMADPVAADYLWTGWLNFLIGMSFETRTETLIDGFKIPLKQRGLKTPSFSATELPYLVRTKSGWGEPWTIMLFAQNENHAIPIDMWLPVLPDFIDFLNIVNDLLSTPKELVAGDTQTYLNARTNAQRQVSTPGSGSDGLWCFEDTFIEACDWTVQILNRLDSITSGRYEHERKKSAASQETADAKYVYDQWRHIKAAFMELHFDFGRYYVKGKPLHERLPQLQQLRLEHRGLASRSI